MQYKAFIGIGANLGSPVENCEKAIGLLHDRPEIKIVSRSNLYNSEPVGEIEQNWFVNTTVAIKTILSPEELLSEVLKIEKKMGRIRRQKGGPRIIDIDILAYEDHVCHSPSLTLPHPEMTKRKFVLLPLSEIAGDYIHPVVNKTIFDLLKELPESSQVKKIVSPL
ncbi:MAG TPA: 2-amino-4-hydroxy-6-hydroxymethyldihydropteridine diphosphokinase [Nitrospinaceae bacterium]|jgi:2-amino-4-hydroxy-6-hydroxymethyldihydropteridine diphosphokinase|nr:2-amino-4-hydroxy-6-hydroxymethyldihydropteridine diphosphokinase [Nitrospinaceae bacterium]